jgi:hypothetical protein
MHSVIILLISFTVGLALHTLLLAKSVDPSTSVQQTTNYTKKSLADNPLIFPKTLSTEAGRIPNLTDLAALNPMEQITWVTNLTKGSPISPGEASALSRVIQSNQIHEVVRNSIGNLLVESEDQITRLPKLFFDMYHNREDSPIWRDYSVQFLALSIEKTPEANRNQASEKLLSIARSDNSTIGATAILQESRLIDEGVISDSDNISKAIRQKLENENLNPSSQQALLSLIGHKKLTEHLDLVRKHLNKPSSDDAKRGGLYAIGQIGTREDVKLVKLYLNDRNSAVAQAAVIAKEKLEKNKKP